ncbi:MAG: amino acid permease [Candidatus Aminicenantia bacterium]
MALKTLFLRKTLDELKKEAEEPEHRLKRVLGPFELTALGIGAIVGAGIFAVTGTAAAGSAHHIGAGPALVISFLITAIACGFSALAYSEFASMIPIAGSAYTYSYATMGELIAWIIGWDLILEYAVGNVAVAVSWAGYFKEFLRGFGIDIPVYLVVDYRTALREGIIDTAPHLFGIPMVFNLPAVAIVAFLTVLLVIGIKESTFFNNLMVVIKIGILILFILIGAFYVKPENWTPFAPNGWKGIMTGAALVFFAYIGFDAITTAAEETKNPKRDLPIGIIGSLLITTLIYITVTLVLTGIVPYSMLATAEPLATALNAIKLNWVAGLVSFGAIVATTAVLLVFQLGQPRIFFSMARDGLLPKYFASVHPKFKTPHVTTIWTGVFVGFFAALVDINEAVELTNIGTLFAFILVNMGIIILRYKEPDRQRPFKTPLVPLIPFLGILSNLYLMISLPWVTWVRFGLWLLIGLIIYSFYGFRKSILRGKEEK